MAKPITEMTVADLQKALESRATKLGDLAARRQKLQEELDKIDEQIEEVSGGADLSGTPIRRRRRRRVKNEKPLHQHVTEILTKNKKGLTLAELSAKVLEAGYRTKSRNFGNVLYQCVFKSDNITHDRASGVYMLQS